jgi:cyclophilin family peptidyl-prolyl cis-trans isomerase
MPHTSKKYKKPDAPSQNNRTTLIIVGVIIAIIAVAGAYYAYSSFKTTTTSINTSTTQLNSTLTTQNSGATNASQSGLVYAKFVTSQGTFEVELFQSLTPKTVSNFVSLANSGFYSNLVWHRIVAGFVIQTGDPTSKNAGGTACNWGSGTSGTTIPLEIVPSLHNAVGYLGMASPSGGLPSSQFYINLANNTSLDGSYTVFGKVISGMSVVDALGNVPTTTCSNGSTPPANPSNAMLTSVTIQDSP